MKFGGAVIGAVQTDVVPKGIDAVDEWVATGQPGSRHLYGEGLCLMEACAPDVAVRMRALSEAGLARLHQTPIGKPATDGHCRWVLYFGIRTGRPVPKGFPALARSSVAVTSNEATAAKREAARREKRAGQREAFERAAEKALFAGRGK